MDLLDALNASTKSINDMLKDHFGLTLYMLNPTTHVKLGTVSPLFMLVVKDGRRGVMEDATTMTI
ncbi:hypothetical protein MUK42_19388 [Musa troglodytarum]|nr:hypothetical protein MUK42_19388 [Musa troglodytarum]